VLKTDLLGKFLRLVFSDNKTGVEYTFWRDGKEEKTTTFATPKKLESSVQEGNYDEVTLSLAINNEELDGVYGIAWRMPTPCTLPVPSLLLKVKDEEYAIYLFDEPVKEDEIDHLKDAFNKDICDLCDLPLPGYEGCGVKKTKEFPKYTPQTLIDMLNPKDKITLSFGPRAAASKGHWDSSTLTVTQLIEQLTYHEEGDKDGTCILQGHVAGRVRTAKSVIANHLIAFDLDTGETADELDDRIAELGYAYVRYTTHSHNTSVTEIKRDAFFKWIDEDSGKKIEKDQIRDYLVDVKGYKERAVEKIKIVDAAKVSDTGLKIVVKHSPIQKHRVIFFLDKLFVFQGEDVNQQQAITEWRERYHGLGSELGFHYDQKTTDPSRLFYLPRHKKGSEDFEAEFFDGAKLDLNDFERLKVAKHNKREEARSKDKKRHKVGTKNLVNWSVHNAKYFELQQVLLDHAPEDIFRDERTSGCGIHMECPFEDDHSSTGGQGFFIIDASENTEFSDGFVAMCSHDGCAGRDRLDFLKGMVENGWIPQDALNDEQYYEGREDDEEEDESSDSGTTYHEGVDEGDETDISDEYEYEWYKGLDSRACYEDPSLIKRLHLLEKDFMLAQIGTGASIVQFNKDPSKFPKYIKQTDWHNLLAGKEVLVATKENESKLEPLSRIYARWPDRKDIWSIIFDPSAPPKKGVLNLFDGFPIKPNSKTSWSILRNHLFEVWANENEELFNWIMTWMADIFQNPGEKRGSSLVLQGDKGTGKSLPLTYLKKLVGKYSLVISDANHLTGRFNSHQKGCLLIICEEAVWAGDKQAEGVLKNLITGGNIILEPKGIDSFEIENFSRFVFTSNEPWVVPSSFPNEERRYLVLGVSNKRKGDYDYFEDMDNQMMKDGGLGAMMHELLNWVPPQKRGWDCLRNPPITDALRDQALYSAHDYELFFFDFISEGYLSPLDDTFAVGVNLNEHEPTIVPSEVVRKHFSQRIGRSVQSSARKIANSAKDFRILTDKYLMQDSVTTKRPRRNMSGTEYEFCGYVGDTVNTDMYKRAYVLIIPPLVDLRKNIYDTYGIDLSAKITEKKE
jgi:hypothetical protein